MASNYTEDISKNMERYGRSGISYENARLALVVPSYVEIKSIED
jgi:hypothetical protein